jgi:hypothetical protein
MTDRQIAEGILEREHQWGIWGRVGLRIAGHDCAAGKPDMQKGGQLPSAVATFGGMGLILTTHKPEKRAKIKHFRERLGVRRGDRLPMLCVYAECKDFLRTVRTLVLDEDDPEMLDEEQEDHAFDEAALLCSVKPAHVRVPVASSGGNVETAMRSAQVKKWRVPG